MEKFAAILIIGLYGLVAYYLKGIILRGKISTIIKASLSIAFIAILPFAYYLLLAIEMIAAVFSVKFDLGHANILAVVTTMAVIALGGLYVTAIWIIYFKRRRVN